jgi:hypothetical protein
MLWSAYYLGGISWKCQELLQNVSPHCHNRNSAYNTVHQIFNLRPLSIYVMSNNVMEGHSLLHKKETSNRIHVLTVTWNLKLMLSYKAVGCVGSWLQAHNNFMNRILLEKLIFTLPARKFLELSLDNILNMLNRVRKLTLYLLYFNFNIILSSIQMSPKLFFISSFQTKILYAVSIFPNHATGPAHLTSFNSVMAYLIKYVIEIKGRIRRL